jgi:hypothetical protein
MTKYSFSLKRHVSLRLVLLLAAITCVAVLPYTSTKSEQALCLVSAFVLAATSFMMILRHHARVIIRNMTAISQVTRVSRSSTQVRRAS